MFFRRSYWYTVLRSIGKYILKELVLIATPRTRMRVDKLPPNGRKMTFFRAEGGEGDIISRHKSFRLRIDPSTPLYLFQCPRRSRLLRGSGAASLCCRWRLFPRCPSGMLMFVVSKLEILFPGIETAMSDFERVGVTETKYLRALVFAPPRSIPPTPTFTHLEEIYPNLGKNRRIEDTL